MLIQACQGEATGSELRRTTQPEEGSESETDAARVSQTSLEESSTTEQTQSIPQPHGAKGAEGHLTDSKAGEACSLDPDPARPTQTLNIILRRPHTVLLLSTVTGGLAYRGVFTGAIADEIRMSDGETDILTMFTRAAKKARSRGQTPEVRSTMENTLFLHPATHDLSGTRTCLIVYTGCQSS